MEITAKGKINYVISHPDLIFVFKCMKIPGDECVFMKT